MKTAKSKLEEYTDIRISEKEIKRKIVQNGFILYQNGFQQTSKVLKMEFERLEKLKQYHDLVDHAKIQKRFEDIPSPVHPATPMPCLDEDDFWNAMYTDESLLMYDECFPGEYLVLKREGVLVGTHSFIRLQERNKYRLGNIYHILNTIQGILDDYDIRLAQIKCTKLEELADQLVYSIVTKENLYSCFTKPQELFKIMHFPGRRFKGRNSLNAAATKIQSIYRMYRIKSRYTRYWELVHVSKVFKKFWKIRLTRRATHEIYVERLEKHVIKHYQRKLTEYESRFSEKLREKSLYQLYDHNVHIGFILPREDSFFKIQVQMILQTSFINSYDSVSSRVSYFHLDPQLQIYKNKIHHDLNLVSSSKCLQQLRKKINSDFKTSTYMECLKASEYNMVLAWMMGIFLIGPKSNLISSVGAVEKLSYNTNSICVAIGIHVRPYDYELGFTCQTLNGFGIMTPQLEIDVNSFLRESESIIKKYQEQRYIGWVSFLLQFSVEEKVEFKTNLENRLFFGLDPILQRAMTIEMLSTCKYNPDANQLLSCTPKNKIPFKTMYLNLHPAMNKESAVKEYIKDETRIFDKRIALYITGIYHSQIDINSRNGAMSMLQSKLTFDVLIRSGYVFPVWEVPEHGKVPIIIIDKDYSSAIQKLGDVLTLLDTKFTILSSPFVTNFEGFWAYINHALTTANRTLHFRRYVENKDEESLKKAREAQFTIPGKTLNLVQQQLASVVLARANPQFKKFSQLSQLNPDGPVIEITQDLLVKLKSKEEQIVVSQKQVQELIEKTEAEFYKDRNSFTSQTKLVEKKLEETVDRSEQCHNNMLSLIDETKKVMELKEDDFQKELESRQQLRKYLRERMNRSLGPRDGDGEHRLHSMESDDQFEVDNIQIKAANLEDDEDGGATGFEDGKIESNVKDMLVFVIEHLLKNTP